MQLSLLEYCRVVLSNSTLIDELKNEGFKLAIVDLVYNECSLVTIYLNQIETKSLISYLHQMRSINIKYEQRVTEYYTTFPQFSKNPNLRRYVSNEGQKLALVWNNAGSVF